MNPLLFLFSLTCLLSGPINGELVGDPGPHASILDPSNPFFTMAVEENETGNDTRGSTTWWENVGDKVGDIWDYLTGGDLVTDIGDIVKSAFTGLLDLALGMATWFFHGMQSFVDLIFSGITGFVTGDEDNTEQTGIGTTIALVTALALIMMVFIGIRITVYIMDMLDTALPDEIMDMIPFV